MRLSDERIKALQILLKERTGQDYTDEEAQKAGMDIMRFVIAKAQREQKLANNKENNDEQQRRVSTAATQQ